MCGNVPPMKDRNKRRAILLVNLGTPDDPSQASIRNYLLQFLSDPRVVDLPRWLWLPILKLIILRVRPAKLVQKYELIWGTHDGPIRNITSALTRRVQHLLPETPVKSAMTYGGPSIADVLRELKDIDHVTILPLFAQYASATTGAVTDAADQAIKKTSLTSDLISDYHDNSLYIGALTESIRKHKMYRDQSPFIVFSYHGIPISQAKRDVRYQNQCHRTSTLVAKELGLADDQWRTTFQSRFGPAPWLRPYTDETMKSLPTEGVANVLLVCPGFAVDCLETIEEIRILNCEIFLEAGGATFGYVKALNASWSHAKVIADVIKRT